MRQITQDELLKAGVRNLREFGYRDVTVTNIMTDYVFASFFVRMLDETLEKLPACKAALELKEKCDATIARVKSEAEAEEAKKEQK